MNNNMVPNFANKLLHKELAEKNQRIKDLEKRNEKLKENLLGWKTECELKRVAVKEAREIIKQFADMYDYQPSGVDKWLEKYGKEEKGR